MATEHNPDGTYPRGPMPEMADSPETLTAEEINLLRANVFTAWQPTFDRLRAEVLTSRARIEALTTERDQAREVATSHYLQLRALGVKDSEMLARETKGEAG